MNAIENHSIVCRWMGFDKDRLLGICGIVVDLRPRPRREGREHRPGKGDIGVGRTAVGQEVEPVRCVGLPRNLVGIGHHRGMGSLDTFRGLALQRRNRCSQDLPLDRRPIRDAIRSNTPLPRKIRNGISLLLPEYQSVSRFRPQSPSRRSRSSRTSST